jgi:hypothetical protein
MEDMSASNLDGRFSSKAADETNSAICFRIDAVENNHLAVFSFLFVLLQAILV